MSARSRDGNLPDGGMGDRPACSLTAESSGSSEESQMPIQAPTAAVCLRLLSGQKIKHQNITNRCTACVCGIEDGMCKDSEGVSPNAPRKRFLIVFLRVLLPFLARNLKDTLLLSSSPSLPHPHCLSVLSFVSRPSHLVPRRT